MPSQSDTSALSTPPPAHPKRRARRWFLVVGLLIAITAGGYVLITRSFVTRLLVLHELGAVVGGKATASSVEVDPAGRVEMRGVTIRARGVEGEAGTVFAVRHLKAEFNFWSLLTSKPIIYSVFLEEPLGRLSQSVDDDSVNAGKLKPAKFKASSGGLERVPRIVIRGGAIEVGEHHTDPAKITGDNFTLLRRVAVAGEVKSAPDADGSSEITFRQVDGEEQPLPGGLSVRGRVSPTGVTVILDAFSLGEWDANSVPAPLRATYQLLDPRGRVSLAEFSYKYSGEVEGRIGLSGVSLTLPLQPTPDVDLHNRELPTVTRPQDLAPLRMEEANGYLQLTEKGASATFTGWISGVPYNVAVKFDGTTLNAPFEIKLTCKNYELKQHPHIMKYAPGLVRRRLASFGDPTGTVNAEVLIARGAANADGTAPPLRTTGSIDFRNATAAFEKFPYRFWNISGLVEFDEKSVRFVRMDGDGPEGSTVHAEGIFIPPNADAGVTLNITAKNIPMDDVMRKAMGQRARVYDAIISKTRYAELVAAGLVRPATSPENASIPEFDLGGRTNINVLIEREPGDIMPWHDTITIEMPKVAILPESFPYPLIAENVTVVKKDETATVAGGSYRGLTGAIANIASTVDIEKASDPNQPFVPIVEIDAKQVPVDELVLHALPQQGTGGRSPTQILRALNTRGLVRALVKLGPGPNDSTAYRAELDLDGLSASPAPSGTTALQLDDLRGGVDVTQDSVRVDLTGELRAMVNKEGSPNSAVRMLMELQLGPPTADNTGRPIETLTVDAAARNLDVRAPLEDVLRIFDASTADAMRDLRASHAPAGRMNLHARALMPKGEPLGVDIETTMMRDVTFNALAGRVGVSSSDGLLRVSPRVERPGEAGAGSMSGVVAFEKFGALMTFDGAPAGAVVVHGRVGLDGKPNGELALRVNDGRFESGLTRQALGKVLSAGIASTVCEIDPAGAFNLDLTLQPTPDGTTWDAAGSMTPLTLGVTWGGTRFDFPPSGVAGVLELSARGGQIRGLRLEREDLRIVADGEWSKLVDGTIAWQNSLEFRAPSLSGAARAVLPGPVRAIVEDLKFACDGPFSVTRTNLSAVFARGGEMQSFRASGAVSVQNAGLDLGVTVSRADGDLDFVFERLAGKPAPTFELWTNLSRFDLAGLGMTEGKARIVGQPTGDVTVPVLSAVVHGGRLAGEAVLRLPTRAGEARMYDATVQLSGLRFASVLEDFKTDKALFPSVAEEAAPDGSRGLLDASLSLSGRVGDAASRRGRGSGRVAGGRIVSLPLLVPVVKFANLQLPIDERLDYGRAEFFLDGSTVNFEQLSISSQSVGIYGLGTMQMPGMDLDLRFRARTRTRIPVISSIMDGIRDEIMTTVVRGKLSDPQIGNKSLAKTGQVLERVMGKTQTEQEQALDRIERVSEPARQQKDRPRDPRASVPE